MPVFNGEATIEGALESLLAQTFGDFELVVSDNASTDGTEALVRAAAAQDSRIRYIRQPTNIGANGNYSFVARTARSEFLKWSSSSDWCAPTFVERCVAALDSRPDAVLAAPRTRLFAGDRADGRDYPHDLEILDETPSARFVRLYRTIQLNNAFNGVIRLSALRQTRLVAPYHEADMVLMGHLALLGKYLLVPEPLFYRRMEPGFSTALQGAEAVRRHHYPTPTARSLFQVWKRHTGWFRAALSAPMPFGDRARVLDHLAHHLVWDRRALADDLGGAWRYLTGGPRG